MKTNAPSYHLLFAASARDENNSIPASDFDFANFNCDIPSWIELSRITAHNFFIPHYLKIKNKQEYLYVPTLSSFYISEFFQ